MIRSTGFQGGSDRYDRFRRKGFGKLHITHIHIRLVSVFQSTLSLERFPGRR